MSDNGRRSWASLDRKSRFRSIRASWTGPSGRASGYRPNQQLGSLFDSFEGEMLTGSSLPTFAQLLDDLSQELRNTPYIEFRTSDDSTVKYDPLALAQAAAFLGGMASEAAGTAFGELTVYLESTV